ncbi:MAG: DUF1573 domain-containing protein [Saprospiraceae bacterium]
MQTKVKFFALSIAIFFAFSLIAQNPPTAYPQVPIDPISTIEFEKTTYDFGVIEEGVVVSQVFTFTNTGDEPLIFMDAKGSCGCTVPQWPRDPIQPGETSSLTVEFNSKGKYGKRSQRVTLTTNTEPPQTLIYLTGEVIAQKEFDYSILDASEKTETEMNPNCFAIYPNPTAEILKLEMEESSQGQLAIVSIYGKNGTLMAKREIKVVNGPIEFTVAHYPAGTYIANVQVGERKPEARCFVVVD